jgi:hypothetical protein
VHARTAGRRLLGSNYVVSKRYAQWRMGRGSDRRLIVFTMGKTGSTALARAIAEASGERVFQVFRLNPAGVAGAEQRFRSQLRDRSRVGTRTFPFPGSMHLWESEFLVNHPPTASTRWDVVTSVREPVGQAVSAFFHAHARDTQRDDEEARLVALRERFLDERWLERPAQWFEREFGTGLGVDAFLQPFDPSVGTSVIERESVRVLLVRQEDFSGATDALQEFLRLPDPVNIARRNSAYERTNASIYEAFLNSMCLPVDVVDETYSSRLSRHFYSDAELAHLRTRWAGKNSVVTRVDRNRHARNATRA